MEDQQSHISILVTYLTIFQLAARSNSVDMTAVFHARPYGRFIEKQANLRRKERIEQIKAPILLEAVLAIEIIC